MLRHCLRSFFLLAAVATLLGGCGPRLSDQELGEKLGELPSVEGADVPASLPELDDTLDASPSPKTPGLGPSLPAPAQ